MTLPVSTLRLRLIAGLAATAAITATLMVGPLALRSSAADYTANSEATWRAALVSAMANTGETNTITLTGDFAMNDPTGTSPEYAEVDQDLIVDGGGHTISAAPGNTAGFLEAYNTAGNVTLQNITLDGFTSDYSVGIEVGGTATLDNVTVRNFDGVDPAVGLWGDAVDISNSTFANNANTGDGDGSAVYTDCDSSFTLENSTFTGNTSQGSGGALYANCSIGVYDSTFANNTAVYGGGAISSSSNVDVHDSTFTGNSTGADGGAISGGQETYTDDSTFTNNHADGDGGAVWSYDAGYPRGSTFRGNTADGDGGAYYVYEAEFVVRDSTFTNNTAGDEGGGAWGYSYADSHESTWVGNEAAYGGAIFTAGNEDYSTYAQSTFIDNNASEEGGAVYADDNNLETDNSVFSGNEAGSEGAHLYVDNSDFYTYATVFEDAVGADGCYAADGANSTGYNFDADGTCTDSWAGTGDFGEGADPMLGTLADNGGPTQTRQPLPGSPLIDAIPWGDCDDYAVGSSDQRGVDRAAAGAEVDGCDIGSVEIIKDISFPIVGSSGTTIVTVTGALNYDCDAWTPIAGYLPTPPAGVFFPHGVFSYCFYVPSDGWTVTVKLDLPSPVTQLWKDTGGTWAQVPGAVISGTTVTYQVTDGGALDDDGEANSYIVDPVGPGLGGAFTG